MSPPNSHEVFGSMGEGGVRYLPPVTSLVISRNLSSRKNGEEVFIPARLLHGILPDVLLDQFYFWQDYLGCLTGYPIQKGQKR